jgi:outer membrane protein OmpA-like peptidoglycan-associated protein
MEFSMKENALRYLASKYLVWQMCMLLWLGLLHGNMAYAQATADPTAFRVQQFRPWGDPQGMWNTQSAKTLDQWGYIVGLFFNYGNGPLSTQDLTTRNPIGLVEHQIGMDLVAGLGLLPWLDFYLAFPMTIYQTGKFPNDPQTFPDVANYSLNGFYLSDMSLAVKFRILDEEKFFISFAAKAWVGLPTAQLGRLKNFNGEDGVQAGLGLFVSKKISFINVALNFGYRYNPETKLLNLIVSHEFFYGLGASAEIVSRRLALVGDISGATNFTKNVLVYSAPLEFDLGLRYYPLETRDLAIHLGMGVPFTPGYGTPRFRVFIGVVWSPDLSKPGDRDGDGIPDHIDKCPDTPGPAENHGCPWGDKDGDGVPDNIDKCPDTPGPVENRGCPWGDKDGDGVPDNIDKCPDTPGPKENHGCPWSDRDGDGIPDKDDKCPDKPGPKKYEGCPDTDGDGIPDHLDKCPYHPGPASNHGCPLAIKEQKKITILKKIFFDFNRDVIKSESYPVLDAVVDILKEHPRIRIRIEGHTDDVGTEDYNLDLSRRRARSVANYLVSKGIDRSRLSYQGHGKSQPLVTGSSPDDRAQNRRVEFIIVQQ